MEKWLKHLERTSSGLFIKVTRTSFLGIVGIDVPLAFAARSSSPQSHRQSDGMVRFQWLRIAHWN